MAITRETSKGQLVAYVFGQADIQDSQTNVQMVNADPGAATLGYCSPWIGEVVGIGWNLSAAFSAGVLTVGASFDGTENANTTTNVTMATVTSGYKRIPRGAAKFAANTVIGCEYTTDGNVEANTVDVTVTIYCLLYMEGI